MKSNVSQPAPWVNCPLCGQPMDDEPGMVHESCVAYEEWISSRPIPENPDPFGGGPANWSPAELDAREMWADEQEAMILREMEEAERVGNNYGN